jgi:quinol monooxygenase YgiN
VSPLFSVLLKDTPSREGNEGVLIYADQDKSTTFILIQQWVSRDHYEH